MSPPRPPCLIIPVKGGHESKTRLGLPPAARLALADAFARDTVAAAIEGAPGAQVWVVTDNPAVAGWARERGAGVFEDPGGGLNAGVGAAAEAARASGAAPAVLLGDHPSLRADEVASALQAAAGRPLALVADGSGHGSAMLISDGRSPWRSAFGPGSAAAHRALGAHDLEGDLPGLRLDVDTVADLRTAERLGLGTASAAELARTRLTCVQATMFRVEDEFGDAQAILDDGRVVLVPEYTIAESGLRHLRPGQRVSIELDPAGAQVTWLRIIGIGPGESIA